MRRVVLLANRRSGTGEAARAEAALRAAGAGEVLQTGLNFAAAREAAADGGADGIALAAGDGGVGEGAAAAAGAGVPLAVLPVGTGNDFAGAMGLPRTLDEAAAVAVAAPREREVDLGWMATRPFVNAASAGLAVAAAARSVVLKPHVGPLAYPLGALAAGVQAPRIRCTVRVDGMPVFHGHAWQVIVANVGAFGGGSWVEAAQPDDGRLDVLVFAGTARLRLARRAWGLRTGRIADQRPVLHQRGSTAELDLALGARFNVDGELVEQGSVAFRVEPRAFRLVVPG